MSEDIEGKKRPGIWVTHDYKERFVQHMNGLLDEDRLYFHDEIESKNDDPEGMFIDQLRNFRRQYNKQPSNGSIADQKIPYKYTGKGKGKTDDLMMASLECAYFMTMFFNDTSYMAKFGKLPIGVADGHLVMEADRKAHPFGRWVHKSDVAGRRPRTGNLML